MHGYYGFPGWGGAPVAGFPWMSAITWAIGLALLAAIVYFGIRGRRAEPPRKDEALDILAERYARGELSKDEYLEASEVLKKR
ncbi:SHOCT domain-containing protein [bacterium]|nr:SHOCT domain-containing protein [bacterium]